MPLDLRALSAGDLSAALALAQSAVPALDLTPRHLEENLLADPGSPAGLLLCACEAGAVLGVGCAATRLQVSPSCPASRELRGHLKLLAVSEGARRRGVGSALLELLERRLAELGAVSVETDGAAPRYLQPGLPRELGEARAFFERRGYEAIEERRSMTVELRGLDLDTAEREEELARRGLRIRRAAPADLDALHRRISADFSSRWADEVSASLGRSPPGTHVALEESSGELAAFACAGLWAANAFGPMGTRLPFAGRGLGTVLLKRCLDDLRRGGARVAVIAWVGPETFYRKAVGAESTLDYTVLRKRLSEKRPGTAAAAT